MISLNEFLVKKHTDKYKYHPKQKKELKEICIKLLKDGQTDLNNIDTSEITDMSFLFSDIHNYHVKITNEIDISQWDVSKVEDMSYMFNNCKPFNSDLSKWDVSNVERMEEMFKDCTKFDCDLSNWDVSNVKDMEFMFYGCKQFNSDLSNWNISNVKDMNAMFSGCNTFEGKGLDNWKINPNNKSYNMTNMFKDCTSLKTKPSWYKG